MSVIAKLKHFWAEAGSTAGGDGVSARPGPTGKYMRGGRGVTFAGWKPALREAQDDIGEAWDDAAARVTDLLHNNGWLAGAMEQCIANTVGTGLQLKALPENETFGMTPVEASDWAKTVERRFELWARNAQECDIQGLRSFGQMQAVAFRSWLVTGEILADSRILLGDQLQPVFIPAHPSVQCQEMLAQIVDHLIGNLRQVQHLTGKNILRKSDDSGEAPCNVDAKLCDHATHAVDQLRALADKQIRGVM